MLSTKFSFQDTVAVSTKALTTSTTALAADSAAEGFPGTRGALIRVAAVEVAIEVTAGPSSRGTSKGEKGRRILI